MNNRFSGKTILITGATSGVGKATALDFAKEGANVVISGRREKRGQALVKQIQKEKGEALFVQTDVGNKDDIKNLITKTVEHYGRLDFAFNNACEHDNGIAKVADIQEVNFDRHINIGLKGLWLCMKYQIQAMLKQGSANGETYSIVNSSSISGVGGGWPLISIYSVVKSGVAAFSKSAAQEYAKNNIRINALGGGFFDTEMIQKYFDELADFQNITRDQLDAHINGMIPLGRMAELEEVSKNVLFLCSEDSSYITGSSIIIDGGMSAKYL